MGVDGNRVAAGFGTDAATCASWSAGDVEACAALTTPSAATKLKDMRGVAADSNPARPAMTAFRSEARCLFSSSRPCGLPGQGYGRTIALWV